MNEMAGVEAAERALGGVAIEALRRRRLLLDVDVPAAAVSADRLAGALAGLALGDALAAWARSSGCRPVTDDVVRRFLDERTTDPDEVSALTQSLVLSAEAWLADGWRAPESLADRARSASRHHAVAGRRRPSRG